MISFFVMLPETDKDKKRAEALFVRQCFGFAIRERNNVKCAKNADKMGFLQKWCTIGVNWCILASKQGIFLGSQNV